MLIDDVTIEVSGGHGGKGAVAFQKNMLSLGPTGTRGGNGGSVYAEGTADLSALNRFRFKKTLPAENGEGGRSQFRDGKDGSDLVLRVPVGTVIHNLETGLDEEITKIGERICVAKGGRGGKGNFHFRSSTNTSPMQFQPGTPGESYTLRLELKLIADVGLIGLPNVGKSSLLNVLTRAQAKVANYPFTTLEPNLGVYYELILADIPGLIEGAAEGRGLGVKFLRHVERTKVLFHLVSAESPHPLEDYATIRGELKKYNPDLLKKPEHVFLGKSDAATPEEVKHALALLKKKKIRAIPLSIIDETALKPLKDTLNKIKEEKLAHTNTQLF